MKKTLFIFAILISFITQAQVISSRYYELGFSVGTLNSSGSITKPFDFSPTIEEVRTQFGVNFNRHFSHYWFVGAEAWYGKLYADDLNRGVERGLNMNTSIVTANAVVGVNFKRFGKYFKRRTGTPYVSIGLGTFNYTPTIDQERIYPEDWTLSPGSYFGFNYALMFGYKWRLSKHSFLGLEFHMNYTNKNNLEGWHGELIELNDNFYGIRLKYSYGLFDN
jgi:hypothetical protein